MIQNRSKTTFTSSVSEVYNIIFFSKIFPFDPENEITSLHAKKTKQKKRYRLTATAPESK